MFPNKAELPQKPPVNTPAMVESGQNKQEPGGVQKYEKLSLTSRELLERIKKVVSVDKNTEANILNGRYEVFALGDKVTIVFRSEKDKDQVIVVLNGVEGVAEEKPGEYKADPDALFYGVQPWVIKKRKDGTLGVTHGDSATYVATNPNISKKLLAQAQSQTEMSVQEYMDRAKRKQKEASNTPLTENAKRFIFIEELKTMLKDPNASEFVKEAALQIIKEERNKGR